MILYGEASDDFTKALSKARISGILSALEWKNDRLLSFYEVTSVIKPRSETYLGMRTIPVSRIIGSEGRYRDFSAAFYPKKEMLRQRWENVDKALLTDVILPPISVYSLGGYYFVRDGNHRVSVAKSQGVEFIDAEVVELDSKIPLREGMSIREIRRAVVDYERDMFISQYKPSYLPMGDIVFNTPGAYPEMVHHIIVHKYFMNQSIHGREISFEEAAIHWYEKVYKPIVDEIRNEHLLSSFPGETEGDMYMWIVRRWDEYKAEGRSVSAEEAVRDAAGERGAKKIIPEIKRKLRYLKEKLSKR